MMLYGGFAAAPGPGDCAHAHGAAHMRAALHSREIQMAKQEAIDRKRIAMLSVGASY